MLRLIEVNVHHRNEIQIQLFKIVAEVQHNAVLWSTFLTLQLYLNGIRTLVSRRMSSIESCVGVCIY